jgi:RHS repeat-associated protein
LFWARASSSAPTLAASPAAPVRWKISSAAKAGFCLGGIVGAAAQSCKCVSFIPGAVDLPGQVKGLLVQHHSGNTAHAISYAYDADGATITMTDATGTSTYTYDPFGELASVTDGSNQTVGYTYNPDGSVTGITYPLPAGASWVTSSTVGYGYDNADRLTSLTDFTGTKISITNTADGLPAAMTMGSSGDTIDTTYGSNDSPASIALTNSSSTLQSFAYADAPSGAVLAESDTPAAPGTPADYTYDDRGRIASMTLGTGSAVNYGFDASGNLITLPDGAAASYDHAGELTSATIGGTATDYTYDAAGDRLSATQAGTAVSAATWNGAGQLTAYQDSSAAMSGTAYDGNGMRTTAAFTTSGGSPVTESYTWSGDKLLEDSGNAYIYAGGTTPVEQVSLSTGTPTYLVADSLGSVRGTVSASGTLAGSTAYDAWGNPQTAGGLTSVTPFGYAGGYTDPDGLIYLINRYYDPATGQFTSLDPDVDQTQQPYAYTAGDPVNSTDPDGALGINCDGPCGSSGSGGTGPSAAVAAAIASPDRTTAHNIAVQYAMGDIIAQLVKRGYSVFQLLDEVVEHYEIPFGKKDYLGLKNGDADIAWVQHDGLIHIWEVKSQSYGYTAAMEAAWYVDCLAMNGDSAETGFDLSGILIGPGTGQNQIVVYTIPDGGWGGILYKQISSRGRTPSFLKKFWEGMEALAAALRFQAQAATGDEEVEVAEAGELTPADIAALGILVGTEEDLLVVGAG